MKKFRVGDLVCCGARHGPPVWEFPLLGKGDIPKCVGTFEPGQVALVLAVRDVDGFHHCRLVCGDWVGWLNDVMLKRLHTYHRGQDERSSL